MANHLYGYSSGAYTGTASAAAGSVYSSRALTEAYHPLSYAYLGSTDADKTAAASLYLSAAPGTPTWPPGVDVPTSADTLSHLKRSAEALYNPSMLGAHGTIGQTEAWYSTGYFAKRSRFDSASNLPMYPQRPGEKDCVHYMQTRTCKFGDSCKFDHPFWVPEGGIPDWKEVPLSTTPEFLPQRPGAPDCPYFLKTQQCKFGIRCKFNHPQENLASASSQDADPSTLPERPSEPPCAFYMKTGKCKFGATCKFHHPKDVQTGQQNDSDQNVDVSEGMPSGLVSPARMHNAKGLPIRPGEADCPFYLKTGSCKYGATCRYNHPDRTAINLTASALGHSFLASPAAGLSFGVVNPLASVYQTIDPRLAQPMLSMVPTVYPQRPGQMECDHYMKTGECKFGERCRFHHPSDRSAPTTNQNQDQSVKLTLAGLPRREGAVHCPYYMKTGSCKYGATCKFDHPPPGEVMAVGESSGDSKKDGGDAEAQQKQ